jgi:hypothetical protein
MADSTGIERTVARKVVYSLSFRVREGDAPLPVREMLRVIRGGLRPGHKRDATGIVLRLLTEEYERTMKRRGGGE